MTKKPIVDISDISPALLSERHSQNTERPRKVLLSSVCTATDHFQARLTGLLQDTKEAIRDGVDHKHKIPPLLVIGSVNQPVVVDGHHRLQVYREMQTQPNQKVNVEWVKGDFETAQCEAFRRNRAASKHLSTDERSQFAWRYLCTQAVEGKLFIDNGRGSFVKPVKEMEGLFSLKRRTTMKLRSEIKNLFAHLEFNQEKLTEVLSTDLRSLSTARWQRQVKGVLAAFYEGTGLSESVSDQVFDEERLTLEMVEVLAKHMRPGWSTERQFADNFCDALGRLMSLSTQQRMVEWLADEETLEALIAAPKDPYEDVF